jgi:hypothetical protein
MCGAHEQVFSQRLDFPRRLVYWANKPTSRLCKGVIPFLPLYQRVGFIWGIGEFFHSRGPVDVVP